MAAHKRDGDPSPLIPDEGSDARYAAKPPTPCSDATTGREYDRELGPSHQHLDRRALQCEIFITAERPLWNSS
jgi:hypothetical protein